MIKFQEIKVGDYLYADNDGDVLRGEVMNLNRDEKQVCLNTGTQDFWYETNQLLPIPLSDEELQNLQFRKELNGNGSAKYSKGAFRMLVENDGDFSRMEVWYRDERRQIMQAIPVHMLQNHFYEMTKVHLNQGSFD